MTKNCDKCGELWIGHEIPFSNEPRSCERARLMRNTPEPLFCRYPEICSVTKKCETQRKYERACND